MPELPIGPQPGRYASGSAYRHSRLSGHPTYTRRPRPPDSYPIGERPRRGFRVVGAIVPVVNVDLGRTVAVNR
ncbi:hypothetical protein ACQPWW_10395 [Micromonospora sp. CA-240977]|uniref:hypothetical protein n=1 Tax=Micromonospora sp. CA-240977 TaxID=3239957 RepID=UPI003D8AB7AF